MKIARKLTQSCFGVTGAPRSEYVPSGNRTPPNVKVEFNALTRPSVPAPAVTPNGDEYVRPSLIVSEAPSPIIV